MDDVQTVPSPRSDGISRRYLFVGAIYGLWALISAALGIPALIYLLFPPKARKAEEWVEVGDITRLVPNTPVEMTFRKNRVDGWKVTSEKSTAWVGMVPSIRVTAFGPQCRQLGRAHHWDADQREC